jgi:hypothetical protein
MDALRKGTLSELIACSWLIKQGYEVFRNICQGGPVDLVVYDPSRREFMYVDVKTLTINAGKGPREYYCSSKLTPKQIALGVRLLCVHPISEGCRWISLEWAVRSKREWVDLTTPCGQEEEVNTTP